MDTSKLGPSQWGLLFILLSMDVMQPFVEFMGLRLEKQPEFVKHLRSCIIENRKRYEADSTVIPPLADRVLDEVRAELGDEAADKLYTWATTSFIEVHADDPQWSAWETLFHRWAHHARIRSRVKLPQGRLDSVVIGYRTAMDLSDLRNLVAAQKAKPLSDWDLEMYAIHQYNNDDELSDPFAKALRMIEMQRFKRFWALTIPTMTADEKDLLRASGQQLIDEMGLWMPEPLVHPNDLRSAP